MSRKLIFKSLIFYIKISDSGNSSIIQYWHDKYRVSQKITDTFQMFIVEKLDNLTKILFFIPY